MISAVPMVVDYRVIAMAFDDRDFQRSILNFAIFKVTLSRDGGPQMGLIEWAPVLEDRHLFLQQFVGRLSMYVLHGDGTVHRWLAAHAEFHRIGSSSAMVLMHPTATDPAWLDYGAVSSVIPQEPRAI